jgi:hypothetical protein
MIAHFILLSTEDPNDFESALYCLACAAISLPGGILCEPGRLLDQVAKLAT